MNWDLLNKQISAQQMGAISVSTVTLLLLLGGFLLGFYFLLNRYFIPFLGSRRALKKAYRTSFILEVLSWTAFTFFALYQLLSDSFYISGVLILIIILAGKNYWRDLLGGVAFKLENKFGLNDTVKIDIYSGEIDEINRRNFRIKTDKEELVTISYRTLSNSVLVKKQAKGKLHSAQLTLQTGQKNDNEIKPLLKAWLLECPWAMNTEEVVSKIIAPGLIQITVYAVDDQSIQRIESYLQLKIRK